MTMPDMASVIDLWQLLTLSSLLLIIYTLYGVVYRLYLSPIAKFPGPKLAGLTLWYEFYYDVVKRGQYTFKIRELHKQYGPIIRINPYELHIDDPDFYDVLYSGSSQRRDKWEWSAKMFGPSSSTFSTLPHDHHRMRQRALLPFFSKRSVDQLEPTIQSIVDDLCVNMEKHHRAHKLINLYYAFSAVSTDVICHYAFGKRYHNVDKEDFGKEWYEMMSSPAQLTPILKQYGWIFYLLVATPQWLVKKTHRVFYNMLIVQKERATQIQEILDGKGKPADDAHNRTIFHEILQSNLPAQEKTKQRLIDEAQLIMAAGILTVTRTLKLTAFYILDNPEVAQKLQEELRSAIPDPSRPAPWVQLQKLPYLTAIINEGLRMSHSVSHRLQRIKPDGGLSFHQWVIPAGTPVGMTSIFMHENPTIFPRPHEFRPERWLSQEGARLEKYLVPFSRGTRSCIGSNLAYAEMYLMLATVFRRFNFELFETTRADVDIAHDFFEPSVRLDSKGIQVKVRSSV